MKTGAASASRSSEAARSLPEGARRSHALEHLSTALSRIEPAQVLDLGGITQGTLDFVTGLGHRLYAENLVLAADTFFPPESWHSSDLDARAVEDFLAQSLPFPNSTAGAALLWDQFHFLPPALATAVAARLHRILRPEAILLAFFHPDAAQHTAPLSHCRVLDERHLLIRPKGAPRPAAPFTPRSIERFFQNFHSVKFFMTRESLQEVIVRR